MAVVDDIANVREALAADSESASVPGSFVRNIITKYEFNQVLSLRTLHLSKGCSTADRDPEGLQDPW